MAPNTYALNLIFYLMTEKRRTNLAGTGQGLCRLCHKLKESILKRNWRKEVFSHFVHCACVPFPWPIVLYCNPSSLRTSDYQ